MFLQDAIVSMKRIQAFLQLQEIDTSHIIHDFSLEKAIEVSGKHSYAYGLEGDQKIKPELDLSFYTRIEAIKKMRKAKV